MQKSSNIICFIIFLFIGFFSMQVTAQVYPGFRVNGRYLYDRKGEKVILRGANAMIVFWDRSGEKNYPELAKTGANCCRIFWMTGHDPEPVMPAADLDETIQNTSIRPPRHSYASIHSTQ